MNKKIMILAAGGSALGGIAQGLLSDTGMDIPVSRVACVQFR